MGDVKRWDFPNTGEERESPDGVWVAHDDHASAIAAKDAEIGKLHGEIECRNQLRGQIRHLEQRDAEVIAALGEHGHSGVSPAENVRALVRLLDTREAEIERLRGAIQEVLDEPSVVLRSTLRAVLRPPAPVLRAPEEEKP